MGYYTTYTVVSDCKDNNRNDKFFNRLIQLSGYEFDYNYGNKQAEIRQVKWYTSNADMKELSKEFCDILFTVYGNGEDDDDLWVAYYKNGFSTEYMRPTIVYPLPMEDEFK